MNTSNRIAKGLGAAFGIILLIAIVISLTATLTMLLWNWTLPDLFNAPRLTFWKAVGLNLLSYLLLPRLGSSSKS